VIRPEISIQAEKATIQALELNPEQRFASAGEFKAALAAALLPVHEKVETLFAPGVPAASGRMQTPPAAAGVSVPQKPAVAGIPRTARAPQPQPPAAQAARVYQPAAPAKAGGPPVILGRSLWLWAGLAGGGLLLGVVILSILVSLAVKISQPQATAMQVVIKVSETPKYTATALPERYTDAQGVEMAVIPAGEFVMGSMQGEVSERPLHTFTGQFLYRPHGR
jgi:formylglycine-generating enzyme required for sulfatase activity